MTIELNKIGQVQSGTFTQVIDGVQFPTAEAIAIFAEAFKLDGTINPMNNISKSTREALASKYGFSKNVMILMNIREGAIDQRVNVIARTSAFMYR